MAKQSNRTNNARKAMLAKVHIAKKELGMDDDTYRDFLEKHTEQRSASKLNYYQLQNVLNAMQKSGFKPKTKTPSNSPLNKGENKKVQGRRPHVAEKYEPLLSKLEAMLADMGLSWGYAQGWAKRMFGGHGIIEWLDGEKLYKLVQVVSVYQRKQKKDS